MEKKNSLILLTRRIRLRELREEDWQAMHEYASDPQVVEYLPFGPNEEKDTRDYLQKEIANQIAEPRMAYCLAIIQRNEDRLIGTCRITITSPENQEGEIGYTLNRQYWGHGYMTEAAQKVITFGFKKLGLHRIFATCDYRNTRSYRVMEKVGMQKEGLLRGYKFFKGIRHDCFIYSILKPDWQKKQEESSGKAGLSNNV